MALLLNHDDVTLRLIKDVRDIQAAMRKRDSLLPLFYVQNENTPAQIVANQDNYSPGNYDVLLLTSSANFTISGMSGGVQGRRLQVFNTGNFAITLLYENGSSLAQNRFGFQSGLPVVLQSGQGITLYYNNTLLRWVADSTHAVDNIRHSQTVFWHNVSGVVPAGLTYYFIPGIQVLQTAAGASPVSKNSHVQRLYFRLLSAQPGTGTLVITVQKNLVNTAITITIPAGSAAAVFSELVTSVAYNAGDVLCITVTNNAATNSGQISYSTIDISPD